MEARKTSKRKLNRSRPLKAGQLTKGQKKHLKDFGELHPVDDEDSGEDEKLDNVNVKKKKKIERIVDDSLKTQRKKQKTNTFHGIHHHSAVPEAQQNDDEDEPEEISAYEQLVSSFGNNFASHLPEFKKLKKSRKINNSTSKDEDINLAEKSDVDNHEEQTDLKDTVESFEENDDINFDEIEDDVDSEEESSLSNDKFPLDPFSLHFEQDLAEDVIQKLEVTKCEKPVKSNLKAGTAIYYPPLAEINYPISTTPVDSNTTLEKLWVKAKLCRNWQKTHNDVNELFTPLQQEIFPIINSYQDFLYSSQDFSNADEIREIYCLHALNHILKTRLRILKNNAKNVQAQKENKELPGEQRDHGLTRPKVLILVPFRDAALKIVKVFLKLITEPGEGQVMNKKRFFEEFGDNEPESGDQNKPDDFKQMFTGNTDDFFRVGMVIMRKAVKLFTEFYSSDIIIASPVGLRAIIGAEGEKKRDYDFLSSIEVLIMDQVDVFLMQNWEHVQHIFDHLHLQPKDSHEVDFSRVRMWNLNGWSKFYRQTLLFSSFMSPEVNFIFNKHCLRKTKILPAKQPGSVCQVAVQIPQVFHKVLALTHKEVAEKRFDFFINKVFSELKEGSGLMSHTAIFVSSYFDFVRLRNFLKKEEVDFLQISEYTSRANISRSRNSFLNGEKPLLLFTERFYFYYRYRIRGIKNIIFYELPYFPQFYSEIVNYMDTSSLQSETNVSNSTVLYSKFDGHKLSRVVGSQRCQQMLASKQTVHMFVTGDND